MSTDASFEHDIAAPHQQAPFMQKPLAVVDAAFNLYGFMPEDDDPRWAFLQRYSQVHSEVGFTSMQFANAWRATYLGDTPSYNSGFVTTINTENVLQLGRALDNLEAKPDVRQAYAAAEVPDEGYTVRLRLTDRLTTDPTREARAVTPCPEALYQLQLLLEGEYLARVGFNIHRETGKRVLSLVNIQGVPGAQERNAAFRHNHGQSPFNILAQTALRVASAIPSSTIRGIRNPKNGNSQLYWGVLSSAGIPIVRAAHKPRQ